MQIDEIRPSIVKIGEILTITGSGFGELQGTGNVRIGGAAGSVITWTNTRITVTLSSTAKSGLARVSKDGFWSNAKAVRIQTTEEEVRISPVLANMVVGESRQMQAFDANGQPVTGLTWSSSDTNVAALSNVDPPVLTAISAGDVTITAGSGTAEITVSATLLTTGTVLWSNPGTLSGVIEMKPAVPSDSGVADVFALQGDGTVQAITSDGVTAWTASVTDAWSVLLPDFSGGLAVLDASGIRRLDGTTGQTAATYTPNGERYLEANSALFAVHSDGTVLAIESSGESTISKAIIGVDPSTGSRRFSVALTVPEGTDITVQEVRPLSIIVAGDQYAYILYSYRAIHTENEISYETAHLRMVRLNTAGAYNDLNIWDWNVIHPMIGLPEIRAHVISNADSGTLVTWTGIPWCDDVCPEDGDEESYTQRFGMAVTAGTVVTPISSSSIADQSTEIVPVLESAGGKFVGTVQLGEERTPHMISFDADGDLLWSVVDEEPVALTTGGTVVTQSGNIYNSSGIGVGQVTEVVISSWRGNSYRTSAIERVLLAEAPQVTTSFWQRKSGNPSGNRTSGRPSLFKLVWKNDCTGQGITPPCGFTLTASNPRNRPELSATFSGQSIATIKQLALNSLKAAFAKYNVEVTEGAPNTGDHHANVVDGDVSGLCGQSLQFPFSKNSAVFFLRIMEVAQWALPLTLTTLQQVQSAAGNLALANAIGSGIGNIAAHEIAHQYFLALYGMDDTSLNTYNGGDCEGGWNFGLGAISWGSTTHQRWLQVLKPHPE